MKWIKNILLGLIAIGLVVVIAGTSAKAATRLSSIPKSFQGKWYAYAKKFGTPWDYISMNSSAIYESWPGDASYTDGKWYLTGREGELTSMNNPKTTLVVYKWHPKGWIRLATSYMGSTPRLTDTILYGKIVTLKIKGKHYKALKVHDDEDNVYEYYLHKKSKRIKSVG